MYGPVVLARSSIALLFLLSSFIILSCSATTGSWSCPVSLPQNTLTECQTTRQELLKVNHATYNVTKPPEMITEDLSNPKDLQKCLLFPLINLTLTEAMRRTAKDPFEQKWLQLYTYLQRTFLTFLSQQMTPESLARQFTSIEDFHHLYITVRELLTQDGKHTEYFRYPSKKEPDFPNITDCDHWKDDNVFVDERSAALNPMSLKRLTSSQDDSGIGVKRSQLDLNKNFDWDKAVSDAVGRRTTLDEEIHEETAFVIHYPYLVGLTNVDDINDLNPTDGRKLKKSTSPIGLFVSKFLRDSRSYHLKPVAIQVDSTNDSPVYTPKDDKKWLLAKEMFQVADFAHVEMVEHLLKTHVTLQPICLVAKRTLSEFHPLGVLLKEHCRGLFVTNINGLPKLVTPKGYMHMLFSIGNVGAIELLNRAYQDFSWADTNFWRNLKNRGVLDREKLPYYPYRDDGLLIWKEIRDFLEEYVALYYVSDDDVLQDTELQNFANELSSNGIGKLKDFPRRLRRVSSVVATFTRILWLPIQHNTVNFPIAYYGAFVPNMPTKLYDDPRAPDDEYSFYNLPDSHVATIQSVVAMSLGSLRYDKLLDYADKLADTAAAAVVTRHYKKLTTTITKKIRENNQKRSDNGHLTYPYLLPEWIPNSINT